MRRAIVRFVVVVAMAAAMLTVGLAALARQTGGIIESDKRSAIAQLRELDDLSQRSLVYARNGAVLAVLHAEENRSPVKLEDVPKPVVTAILDMEDERFWRHGGIDLRSTLRALVTNVQEGEIAQGGSTITQQLVKNALLTPEKSLGRKVREAAFAVRLEDALSKKQILERYLNTVYFGNGAYGVQAAAETYWGIGAEKLTAGQAALLAGMIRNPVGYDPIRFAERAKERRSTVVARMLAEGHLTPDEAVAIDAEPLPPKLEKPLPPPNDYFVEEVKQRLLDDPRLGETAQERYNAVFKGGLSIHTTMDPALQDAARRKVDEILPDTQGKFTAAVATVEPASGAVRAIVAGDDFGTAKYNLATQGRRQPGSSFKTFALVAALENGYGPGSGVDGSAPCAFKLPGVSKIYSPSSSEGAGGNMTLSSATAASVNCAYVRIGLGVGLDKVITSAKKLGITSPLEEVASLPLGSKEVSPLEMASAYATLANDGVRQAPHFVEKVVDRRGKVVFEGKAKGEQVVTPQVARMTTQVLQGVVNGGTGGRARLPGRQVAGKTGTSQNNENAWFVGYTPQLSTAVWMGAPVGNVPMRNVGGIVVFGGTYPARIWGAFMAEALQGQAPVPFTPPDPRQIPRGKSIGERFSVKRPGTTIVGGTATTRPPAGARPSDPAPGPAPRDTRPPAPSGFEPPPPTDPPPTSPPPTSPPSTSPPATQPPPD